MRRRAALDATETGKVCVGKGTKFVHSKPAAQNSHGPREYTVFLIRKKELTSATHQAKPVPPASLFDF